MTVTLLSQLQLARDQIAALIVSLTASPSPNTNLQGRSIETGTYLQQLLGELQALDEAIQRAGGPFEVRVYGQ